MTAAARLQQLLDEATPGPWRVGNGQSWGYWDIHTTDDANALVAKVWPTTHGASEADNAALIALTPELAAWAKDAADELARHCPGCTSPDTTGGPGGLCDSCALLARLDGITGDAE